MKYYLIYAPMFNQYAIIDTASNITSWKNTIEETLKRFKAKDFCKVSSTWLNECKQSHSVTIFYETSNDNEFYSLEITHPELFI